MNPDYYAILGVAPQADLNVLRHAYRRRAQQCHPDKGGSHEAMTLLNTAWAILSNPETRRRYDEARAEAATQSERAAADADAAMVRWQAGQYPRSWAECETWLDRVCSDFHGASYGTTRGMFCTTWPTVANSVSGQAFLVAGAIVGGIAAFLVLGNLMAHPTSLLRGQALAFGGAIGAWLMVQLHKWLGSLVKPRMPQRQSQDAVTVTCRGCGRRLRLGPARQMRYRCPACRREFVAA
jgi:hypothetical protein